MPASNSSTQEPPELGFPIGDYPPRPTPDHQTLIGLHATLVPLTGSAHAAELFAAFADDGEGRDWTYLAYGPFADEAQFGTWCESVTRARDIWFYAVISHETQSAVGVLALMRVDAANGCIEVGHVHFAPSVQRSRVSTEAFALVARYVFEDLGYRRLEWKCDALNLRSRKAAERFGFRFEGIFRQHMVYKRRNRDTAWYSMLDREWAAHAAVFGEWLRPANFDAQGRQYAPLRVVTTND